MMTLATVANARNISASYAFGSSVLFYDLVVCTLFFLPATLIVCKFTTEYSGDGGIFSWVSRGLGWRAGAIAVWLQWLENVFFYPLALLFIISSVAEIFSYHVSPLGMCLATNFIFLSLTAINLKGVAHSSKWIEVVTIIGLCVPLLILVMASLFAIGSDSSEFHTIQMKLPEWDFSVIRDPLLITLAGFLGVEVNAVHSDAVENPSRTIPLSVMVSSALIITCIVGGIWLMLSWLPSTGVNVGNAFAHSLNSAMRSIGIDAFSPLVIFFMVLGPLGGITAWIIAPVHALKTCINTIFPNKESPVKMTSLLGLQASLVGIISLLYFFYDIEHLFVLMTDAMVALYLLMYVMMFISAWRLINSNEVFMSNTLTRICCIFGISICSLCFILCFWKPHATDVHYGSWLLMLLTLCVLPFVYLLKFKKAD